MKREHRVRAAWASWASWALGVSLLSACGGGGGGDGITPPPNPSAGVPDHVRSLACNRPDYGGWCWQQPRPSGNFTLDYAFVDAQTGWSVGERGDILKTVDGGVSWTRQQVGTTELLTHVGFADASHGWVLGEGGTVLRTSNGGASWALQSPGFPYPSSVGITLHVINAMTAVVSSSRAGQIRTTTDGGATWAQREFQATAIAADGTLWTLGERELLKSTDLGRTTTSQPVDGTLYSRLILSGTRVLLAGVSHSRDSATGQLVSRVNLASSTDGGAQWTRSTSPALPLEDGSLRQLGVAEPGMVYVPGKADLFRSMDAGATWSRLVLPAGVTEILNFAMLDGGVLFLRGLAADDTAPEFVSDDRGETWRRVSELWMHVPDRLRRIGTDTWLLKRIGGASRSTDGMRSWTPMAGGGGTDPRNALISFWFFDARRGLAINQQGELLRTTNGGLAWTAQPGGSFPPYYIGPRPTLQFASSSTGWLLSADGELHRSTDGGASWSARLNGDGVRFHAFQFLDEARGFALAYQQSLTRYVLMASSDGGRTWEWRANLPDGVNRMAFGSANQGMVMRYGYEVLSTWDGGRTWATRDANIMFGDTISRITFSEPGVAWAVGSRGMLLNSLDGGQTWTRLATGTKADFENLRFLDAKHGWALGRDGVLFVTRDAGRTWTQQATGTSRHLNEVFFVDNRTGWLTSDEGAVLATGTGGE